MNIFLFKVSFDRTIHTKLQSLYRAKIGKSDRRDSDVLFLFFGNDPFYCWLCHCCFLLFVVVFVASLMQVHGKYLGPALNQQPFPSLLPGSPNSPAFFLAFLLPFFLAFLLACFLFLWIPTTPKQRANNDEEDQQSQWWWEGAAWWGGAALELTMDSSQWWGAAAADNEEQQQPMRSSCSSQQWGAAAADNEQQPMTMSSSRQQQPTTMSSSRQQPTTMSSSQQQQPMTMSSSRWWAAADEQQMSRMMMSSSSSQWAGWQWAAADSSRWQWAAADDEQQQMSRMSSRWRPQIPFPNFLKIVPFSYQISKLFF